MIEIIVSLCLIADPKACRTDHLTFVDEAATALSTPYGCILNGQAEVVKYLESRPKYRLGRWTCKPVALRAEANI